MNKVITDGLVLMPTPFANGLNVWSSGDGTPGSDTYAISGSGSFVSTDQDFGGCLEILKVASLTKLRYMAETTILPGCYLQVKARVKAVAGPLPSVRIAGWAGGAGGAHVGGLVEVGPTTQLMTYGEVVEISAIIGTGQRTGVNLVWRNAIYGHFGLDLTGANGGIVRVDDISIEDITSVFHRNMMAMVDVRDYGALGNGATNDAAAFDAADLAANGREILVPAGTYYLAADVTLVNRVRFEGTITMPVDKKLILQKNFDYPTYVDAFGNEELAFKKAYQALLNFSDHEGLDLGGRRISLSAPVNMQAADPGRTTFATRRVIRNGQFQPIDGPAWDDVVVTSVATYAAASPLTLTGVVNIANIQVGALVTGNGVGREIYVTAVNVGQQRITLSRELYDAEGTQTFTFRRFKYLLDFSGYDELSQFVIADVEFQCDGKASGVMLARQGLTFALRDCFFTKPKDRGVTSIGTGCQGMLIDRCQFQSNEQSTNVLARTTIGLNANANDIKIRDNRAVMFKHFAVIGGTGSLISGNHWFQGDTTTGGVRIGGIVLTAPNQQSVITGNYIDNNFIEWTNEHDSTPALGAQFSFGGLTITGNTCVVSNVAPWFNWLVIKPYGPGHYVHGLSVISNVFRTFGGNIDRIERVDTTFAELDYTKMRNINFIGNVFNGINQEVRNPVSLTHTQSTAAAGWVITPGTWLPFNGMARTCESVVPVGRLNNASGGAMHEAPYVEVEYGASKRQIRAVFATPVTGTIRCQVRIDNPQ